MVLFDITDHCPVFVTMINLLTDGSVSDKVKIRYRLINDINMEKFLTKIQNDCWEYILNIDDVVVTVVVFP